MDTKATKHTPVATLPRSVFTEWRDYAVYRDPKGGWTLNGERVRCESVYCVPTNLEPRWTVTTYGDNADQKAVELLGLAPVRCVEPGAWGARRGTEEA